MRSNDWWLKLAQPGNWLLFLVAYLLLHMGMRLLLSDTLQLDDAEQLIHSQEWRLDYGNFQPPFYTWMLWGLWQIVDPSMGALYLIRYLIIGLTFWLWYRVSCLLFDDPRWIVASASSWLLLGEFAWKLHQGSTHTTLLTLALIMSLHAIVLLLRDPRQRYYLYLGLAVGLGMMSKYSYAGFLVPMLVAGLAVTETRDRLLRWPMLGTLSIASLVMLPVLWTLLSPEMPVGNRLQAETSHSDGGLLRGDPSLLLAFTKGALNFLAPMFLIYLTVFRVWPLGAASSSPNGGRAPGAVGSGPDTLIGTETVEDRRFGKTVFPIQALLDRFHILGLALLLVVALFAGIDHLKVRWLHPFLTLVPFWWLLHANRFEPRKQAWRILKWVTVSLIALVLIARLWQILATPYLGKKPSRVTWPVMEALEQIPREALNAAEIRVGDSFLGGHIRLLTGKPVRIEKSAPGEMEPVIWLWGSVQRDDPGAATEPGHWGTDTAHWYRASRGNAVYQVVCVAGSPELVSRCQPRPANSPR